MSSLNWQSFFTWHSTVPQHLSDLLCYCQTTSQSDSGLDFTESTKNDAVNWLELTPLEVLMNLSLLDLHFINKNSAVVEIGQPYCHNRHGSHFTDVGCPACAHKPQTLYGATLPLSVGGAGSPSNTMWPGTRPTSVPSGTLIHLAVWPQ